MAADLWSGLQPAGGLPSWVVPVLLAALAPLALLWPRPPRTASHAVFVRAPPQAVWDAYFMHVRRADYRPGRRILDIETLSRAPLTIRATIRMDYASAANVVTYAFPLYEPPRRYRIDLLAIDGTRRAAGFTEAGEFVEQDGGTWLRFRVAVPRSPWVAGWLAGRRVRRDLRALAAFCEGRPAP